MVAYKRWSLTGSFTNSNLTDGGTNRDFWLGGHLREVVTYERWSLKKVPLYM